MKSCDPNGNTTISANVVLLHCFQRFDTVGWASGRASGLCKIEWWGVGVVVCLERGANCLHIVQLMPLSSPSSLASFKSRLVLSFWYRLTQVVLEKRLLNGCSSSSCCCSLFSLVYKLDCKGINDYEWKLCSRALTQKLTASQFNLAH